jgi:hypothetical protein
MALTRLKANLVKAGTITSNNIADGTITTADLSPAITGQSVYTPIDIAYLDGQSASNGEIITITGSGFVPGMTVLVANETASITSILDSNTITFTAPDLGSGMYMGYIIHPDGRFTVLPGIAYA